MVDNPLEEDIRWLRVKLAEAKTEQDKRYILKQLELLEAKEVGETQQILVD